MTHTQAYARPSSDVTDGNWVNSSGNNTDLFSYIDEAVASDSDYIQVQDSDGSAETCEVGLGAVDDPGVATGHKVTFRASENSGMNVVTLVVLLRQGTTTIKTMTENTFGSAETFEHTLSSGEANSISDYSALRLHFTATDGMGTTAVTRVYQAFLECPAPDEIILAPVASKANVLGMFD